MHLVHAAADGSTLVVAVFLRAGAANATLAPMFSQLPKQSGAHARVTQVNLSALIPRHEESARYTGSLTTPPFTKGVRWVVIARQSTSHRSRSRRSPLSSRRELAARPAVNGRRVATDDSHFERDEG